ncbi:hypothetical protein FF38_13610 [Lucilia cuprina]|uniref:Uncharacterized protein n=1 Tax=Lucilia cuprina TaxID=7375 RepID=A0A0L0CA70_LUCCU|nr:hypothetical protein FF38_13610 [Lucilia cuprina]
MRSIITSISYSSLLSCDKNKIRLHDTIKAVIRTKENPNLPVPNIFDTYGSISTSCLCSNVSYCDGRPIYVRRPHRDNVSNDCDHLASLNDNYSDPIGRLFGGGTRLIGHLQGPPQRVTQHELSLGRHRANELYANTRANDQQHYGRTTNYPEHPST